MSEVCHDVSKEPSLQPLSGKLLSLCTWNWNDGAWLYIRLPVFGVVGSNLFFDIQIFNPRFLTLMLLQTNQTLTTSMKVQSAEHMKSELMRLNM